MSSQFSLVSDLHLEASGMDLETGSARLLAACGDIHAPSERLTPTSFHPAIDWLARKCPDVPVLYVPGNHDYEGQKYEVAIDSLRHSAQGTNVVVLCNDTFDFEGVRFLGTPLFTDFSFDGELTPADIELIERTTDLRKSFDQDGKPLSVSWMQQKHAQARAFLQVELARDLHIPKVVLTHWCPTRQAASADFADRKSGYWITPCEDLVAQADAWCHGHVHRSIRVREGNDPNKGAVYSNPRGWSKLFNIAQNQNFRQPFLIDLPTPSPKARPRSLA